MLSIFNVTSLKDKEINRAKLWLFINRTANNIRVTNNLTQIYIYTMVPPGKGGGPPLRNYVMRRKRNMQNTFGWHHFDVTGVVSTWTTHLDRNLGMVVEALDTNNNNMIDMPPTIESNAVSVSVMQYIYQ